MNFETVLLYNFDEVEALRLRCAFKNEGKDKKSVKGAVFGADWILDGK